MRKLLTLTLAIATIGGWYGAASAAVPSAVRARAITYSAPAGARPDGPFSNADPFSAIVPNGRIVSPAGKSVVVGANALGVALSPEGRYAIVSNDDERISNVRSSLDADVGGGMSLAVVDTETMRTVFQYRAAGVSFFVGVVAVRDPINPNQTLVFASDGPHGAVRVFGLTADGRLIPDRIPVIVIAGPLDVNFADFRRSFPSSLVASSDGRFVYVVNNLASTVATIDVRARSLTGAAIPVGFFPLAAALSGERLLVANEGLMRYGRLGAAASAPQFAPVVPDLGRASSLSLVTLGSQPVLGADAVPMDQTPDGVRNVGGAHPAAIAPSPDGAYAFVAMSGVDRISTVALGSAPRVVGGIELRLFDRGPYGTQPDALALSRDGTRLYVALAGLNAVAVLDAHDPVHLHRMGLVPTGWYPAALALSPDDKTLYVANAKGFGEDASAMWSTLQQIDLTALNLVETTRAALVDTRATRPAPRNPVVPQTVLDGSSKMIKHVVFVVQEEKTYDAVLGDLGTGDPGFLKYGASITPNLHALAQTYGLAVNIFADADNAAAAYQIVAGGIASTYTEKTTLVRNGRLTVSDENQDPEDYPRAGYIFDNLARHGMSYRDYGGLLQVAGYDQGRYTLDVPAPRQLGAHVDLNYPGWNTRVRDEQRAQEFVHDFGALAAAGRAPAFSYVWLPGNRGDTADQVADGDRALGTIVESLSRLPVWRQTAIFILPNDAQGNVDHVDPRRIYAVVVSPYAKRGYQGPRHLSTVSVLKTIEEVLGLPSLSLGDLLATDMADFFTVRPNFAPFAARR
ncbi:MAG TPA: alkaline phosphatase family protein [Candidatus Binatia bacterium]|nr:alkaline phosphatase family protein [Candidatus Binatia bacterium]